MLDDDSGYNEPSGGKMAERCKPDYERMIKQGREKLGRSVVFRNAALAYFEDRTAMNKMAELIGELVTECNKLERELDRLVQAQEDDNEGP